jgi:beta-phosphoglucomutase-like phosphatase (HAD superfamily)
MDGVITDTMPYHFRAWKSVFASEGIRASHEDIYKREGQKGIDSVRELFAEKEKFILMHWPASFFKKKKNYLSRSLSVNLLQEAGVY